MIDVCCLGILVADITVKPVNSLPNAGGLSIVDNISLGMGGCAANTAASLQKLGIKASVIGKVGDDLFGHYLIDALYEIGADIRGIKKTGDTGTSSAIVTVNDKGERSFLHKPGTNGDFTEADVDLAVVKNARLLFIAGALLIPQFDGEPTARLLKKAQEAGIYTALDTAWDASGRWMRSIGPCLPYLDLFIPSIDEAEALSGEREVSKMADCFLSHGVGLCVIKMGKSGCYVKARTGEEFTSPACKLAEVKDTTGAGDAFVAGFLTGIIKGWDLRLCADFANAVGGMCVSHMGTATGIRSIEETLLFMKQHEAGEIAL